MSKKPNDKRATRPGGNAQPVELNTDHKATYFKAASTNEDKGQGTHGSFSNRGQKRGNGDQEHGNERLMDLHKPTQIDGQDVHSAAQKKSRNVASRTDFDGKGLR